MNNDDDEPTGFGIGDDVRIVTTGKIGRINNADVTGTYFEIWMYGGGVVLGVPEWQLEFAAELSGDEYDPDPPAKKDNVINFTDAKAKLTAKTKTKGVA